MNTYDQLIMMRTAGQISDDEFGRAVELLREQQQVATPSDTRRGQLSEDDRPTCFTEKLLGKNDFEQLSPIARSSVRVAEIAAAFIVPVIAYAFAATWLMEPASGRSSTVSQTTSVASLPSQTVRATDYGATWPFGTHSAATIRCRIGDFGRSAGQHRYRPIVTVKLGTREYGLNGAAMGVGGYPDSRQFMPRDSISGTYDMDQYGVHSDFLDMGLTLCKQLDDYWRVR